MKLRVLSVLAFALLSSGAADPTEVSAQPSRQPERLTDSEVSAQPSRQPERLTDSEVSTQRRVHGVITAIAPDRFTIESAQHAVVGRIDPNRTRVTVNGKPAHLSDLKVSDHAKAELCLDDVWVSIDTH